MNPVFLIRSCGISGVSVEMATAELPVKLVVSIDVPSALDLKGISPASES